MTGEAEAQSRPQLVAIGDNDARVFGLDARTRLDRLASKAGLAFADNPVPGSPLMPHSSLINLFPHSLLQIGTTPPKYPRASSWAWRASAS